MNPEIILSHPGPSTYPSPKMEPVESPAWRDFGVTQLQELDITISSSIKLKDLMGVKLSIYTKYQPHNGKKHHQIVKQTSGKIETSNDSNGLNYTYSYDEYVISMYRCHGDRDVSV